MALQGPRQTLRTQAHTGESDDDMREIALVFSHDFREPVQQIVRLARRGQRTETIDGSVQLLRQVLECAERAGTMLDGMIEYLSVSERETKPASVELSACLDLALDNLLAAIKESGAEIRAAQLPTLIGDEQQMVHSVPESGVECNQVPEP